MAIDLQRNGLVDKTKTIVDWFHKGMGECAEVSSLTLETYTQYFTKAGIWRFLPPDLRYTDLVGVARGERKLRTVFVIY